MFMLFERYVVILLILVLKYRTARMYEYITCILIITVTCQHLLHVLISAVLTTDLCLVLNISGSSLYFIKYYR